MPRQRGVKRMTTVTLEGTKADVQTLKAFAVLQGEEVGTLVRKALYAVYGTELHRLSDLVKAGSVSNDSTINI